MLHDMIDEPPELISAFGEYQGMSAKRLMNSTKKQNWNMARKDYKRKYEREEKIR